MSVIAIDPGIEKTGYAVGAYPNKVLETGTIKTSTKDGEDYLRVLKIKNKIKELINQYKPTTLLIEKYRVYGDPLTRTGKKHGEKTLRVIQSIEELALENNMQIEELDHNSWKARYNRIWSTIVMSRKFKELDEIHTKLSNKANYTKDGKLRRGKKEDHELDAFKMLIPEIISFTEVI